MKLILDHIIAVIIIIIFIIAISPIASIIIVFWLLERAGDSFISVSKYWEEKCKTK